MIDSYVGTIALFTLNPFSHNDFINWLPCDGRNLNTDQYGGLFALIAYKYGGAGKTFSLPKLDNVCPNPNMKYYICYNGIFPQQP